ncbi:MAG: DNA polymerase IV [Chitinophagaceae bacterium]
MAIFKNHTRYQEKARVLFIDMNSFFASCEQQENVAWRNKPLAVCGNHSNSVIIAPSKEAKLYGVKTGMRLKEAQALCPHIISVAPHSSIYRKYHIGVMNVLRSFADNVIPKSIDEAVLNLNEYELVYPDMHKLALDIKRAIQTQVGDWLTCSIGIAPNTFLAKLATDLQKPDGLVEINKENIDSILEKLDLMDLPGIAEKWNKKLQLAGIKNPKQLRHTSPEVLKKIMGGIIGYYWHYRLNFAEVDYYSNGYKSMSAVRTLSGIQRSNPKMLMDIFLSLCMKLENRMVQHEVYTKHITFYCSYVNGAKFDTYRHLSKPIQDGTDLFHMLIDKIAEVEKEKKTTIFTPQLRSIGVAVNQFIPDSNIQYELFDNQLRKNQLRKTVYSIKDKFGKDKLIKAVELRDEEVVKDVIGFGSVKDMYKE